MIIMNDFREGKYDVLVNVKMLTEGINVPDVKTVMITRQTTGPILFTQMVGRALRGRKAGGGVEKDHANIVLFMDNWKRLHPFVNSDGGIDPTRSKRQGRNQFDTISIQLVKNATADIMYEGFADMSYLSFIPVGWFATEYTVSIKDNGTEEFVACMESVVVYDFNKQKYDKLIELLSEENLVSWADEGLEDDAFKSIASSYANRLFMYKEDKFHGNLYANITEIIRHMANNETKLVFLNFNEQNTYDLDRIALEIINLPPRESVAYFMLTERSSYNFRYKDTIELSQRAVLICFVYSLGFSFWKLKVNVLIEHNHSDMTVIMDIKSIA